MISSLIHHAGAFKTPDTFLDREPLRHRPGEMLLVLVTGFQYVCNCQFLGERGSLISPLGRSEKLNTPLIYHFQLEERAASTMKETDFFSFLLICNFKYAFTFEWIWGRIQSEDFCYPSLHLHHFSPVLPLCYFSLLIFSNLAIILQFFFFPSLLPFIYLKSLLSPVTAL